MVRPELTPDMIPDDVKGRLAKLDVDPDDVDWYAGRTKEIGFSEIPPAERERLLQEARERRSAGPGTVRRLLNG